ncbi:hypothetical protein [Fluviicola taffensis]|uniref:Lipocalin family protein n=1 Tax=Fluviicola taffensis (strain DSM 16823 / NCIMB 13979 / RW262) TaxID=755732 RepID=F2IGD2_FLUTR|nr:hypothetical protein [Fluviicola taffensis]AEA45798.1 hypothetical protein Fluta_3832 [Fluviicola taffensis DSM 16823]
MKQILLLVLFITISQLLMSQIAPLNQLEGKWFVNRSNFPMWLKGNKTNPSFNYSVTTRKGETVLLDEVLYTKKSKIKSIVGYDKPSNDSNTSFIWRGKGILGLLKSNWSILFLSTDQNWMIIHFKKTLFTPEGYDVISRSKTIDSEVQKEVFKKLKEFGIEEKLSVIHHD